jgi:very-short-patch-repair endonuclease
MPRKSSIDMNELRRCIEVEKMSTYKTAEVLGCNQSHVVRLIAKHNKANPDTPIKKRNKSEAQLNYLKKTGTHQREGTTHSDGTKDAISDKMREFYESEEGEAAKDKIREFRQQEWAEKTDAEKTAILEDLKSANRAKMQSGEGSNFENYLAEQLTEAGYAPDQRTKAWTPGNKFHVDIALPNEKIIIEVDGPTHWAPIYGEAELQKVKDKDARKDMVLHANGWDVLRVQDSSGSTTRARFKRVLDVLRSMQYSSTRGRTYYVKP